MRLLTLSPGTAGVILSPTRSFAAIFDAGDEPIAALKGAAREAGLDAAQLTGIGSAEPTVHVHVVLGRADGSLLGGHLLGGRVRPTLEVVITEAPAELRRRHDPATGLALIDRTESAAPNHRRAPEGAT